VHLLNDIEKEIVRLICEEKTSEEISKQLFILKRSVERIRAKILEKADVKTPVGLVIFAIKNSLYLIKS
jgi:DNA-binding CsgD family transcriptional regulator